MRVIRACAKNRAVSQSHMILTLDVSAFFLHNEALREGQCYVQYHCLTA